MKSAKEEEFELFSLFISCSVPTLEIIRRKQKTVRYKWNIMNIEILEKNPNHCANEFEMSTPILKTLLSQSENKDIFRKKGNLTVFNASVWDYNYMCKCWTPSFLLLYRCFSFLRQGESRLQNRVVTRTGTSDELSQFIENSNWRASQKCLSLKSFAKPHEIPRFGWLKQLRAFVEISLAIVRVLNDISSQLNWGTSDSRKGCIAANANHTYFKLY